MLDKLKNWFTKRPDEPLPPEPDSLHKTGSHTAPRPKPAVKKVPRPNPEFVDADDDLSGRAENTDPDKNVLIRNKYLREDTGTHETLKILDDSMVETGEEPGFDPYNTGGFDRSRNWDKRFGK